jgi:hypothetical protein
MSYQQHDIHSHHNSCLSASTTAAAASTESSQHSRKDSQTNANDKKSASGNVQNNRRSNDGSRNSDGPRNNDGRNNDEKPDSESNKQNNRPNLMVSNSGNTRGKHGGNNSGNNNRQNNRNQPSSSRTRETQHVTYGIDSGNNYKYVADYHNNAITPSKIIQSPFNDGKQKIQFSNNNKLVVLSPGGPNQNSGGQTHFIITQQPTNISNITGNLGNSNSIGEHFVATINDQQHIVLDASQLHTGLTPKPGQNFTFGNGRMNGDYPTIAIQGQHGEIITESQLATTPDGKNLPNSRKQPPPTPPKARTRRLPPTNDRSRQPRKITLARRRVQHHHSTRRALFTRLRNA